MKYFILLSVFLLVLTACGNKTVDTKTSNPPAETINIEDGNYIINVGQNVFSIDELARHDNQEDCWLVINNKVYDVTGYEDSHPGGKDLLEGCGKDATDLFFDTPHSEKASSYLPDFYIGDLE